MISQKQCSSFYVNIYKFEILWNFVKTLKTCAHSDNFYFHFKKQTYGLKVFCFFVFFSNLKYCRVASFHVHYLLENKFFVKRSQYIRIKNPLHKRSEIACMCFKTRCVRTHNFMAIKIKDVWMSLDFIPNWRVSENLMWNL